MPFPAVAPPERVPTFSGFDYVTVDSVRRRVYAAHSGSQALLVVDADSGKVITQIRVGPLHGVAVDPDTGHVYTGNGDARSISEVDPAATERDKQIVRTVEVAGPVDAVVYDPNTGRILADEDDGPRLFVIDAKSFKQIATVTLPGNKLEYLAVDPASSDIFQNVTDRSEVAVIDGHKLNLKREIPTTELGANHPLQYDPEYKAIVVGGTTGHILSFNASGKLLGSTDIQQRVDQCDLDRLSHTLACAGGGLLTFVKIQPDGNVTTLGHAEIPRGAHTVGVDFQTQRAWIVWSDATGDFVQGFSYGR
jgi:DNA-binding beta-propeller fold protein YncE